MKLNLRTILIIVIGISTISISSIDIITQLILILISSLLFFIIAPSQQKLNRILHRIKSIFYLLLIIFVFQVIFRKGGEEYFSFLIFSITSEGITFGISIALRFLLIIIIAGLLFEIPLYDYLLAFKAWKFPYEISFLIAAVIHFIPIFGNQFQQSREALQLRGIDLNKISFKSKIHALQALLFPVLAKAISEVKFRSISLELKAFRLFPDRTYLYERKLKSLDYFVQFGVIILILLFV